MLAQQQTAEKQSQQPAGEESLSHKDPDTVFYSGVGGEELNVELILIHGVTL